MKMSKLGGGKHAIKAAELGPNARHIVTIDRIQLVTMGTEKKAVLYFGGHERGVVLNVTNIRALTELFGTEESDEWIGRRVELYTTMVEFQGRSVLGIRFRAVTTTAGDRQPPRRTEPREEDPHDVHAGDIRW